MMPATVALARSVPGTVASMRLHPPHFPVPLGSPWTMGMGSGSGSGSGLRLNGGGGPPGSGGPGGGGGGGGGVAILFGFLIAGVVVWCGAVCVGRVDEGEEDESCWRMRVLDRADGAGPLPRCSAGVHAGGCVWRVAARLPWVPGTEAGRRVLLNGHELSSCPLLCIFLGLCLALSGGGDGLPTVTRSCPPPTPSASPWVREGTWGWWARAGRRAAGVCVPCWCPGSSSHLPPTVGGEAWELRGSTPRSLEPRVVTLALGRRRRGEVDRRTHPPRQIQPPPHTLLCVHVLGVAHGVLSVLPVGLSLRNGVRESAHLRENCSTLACPSPKG